MQDLSQVFEALLQRSLSQIHRDCDMCCARDLERHTGCCPCIPMATAEVARAIHIVLSLRTSKSVFTDELFTVDAEILLLLFAS